MKTKNQYASILFLIPIFMFTACAQTTQKQDTTKKNDYNGKYNQKTRKPILF